MEQIKNKNTYDEAVAHISDHWRRLEVFQPHDEGTLIGLPRPYIVPSNQMADGFAFREQYYWDTYFTALGLIGDERSHLIEGMLENLVYMVKRFGMIPNASRYYFLGHSHPPVLTSMIMLTYRVNGKDANWLNDQMAVAKEEYRTVWCGKSQPHIRMVHDGLSRYYDINFLHDLAECESGWDMTNRFDRKALDYLPVDLNSLLFKYEMDFATAADLNGDETEAREWRSRAGRRRANMNKYHWNPEHGFFFDYNYQTGRHSKIWSLAGYYPMWAGMVTTEQAVQLVNNLKKFLHDGGLAATSAPSRGEVPEQWAHPNGWAPLQYIVIEGLRRYGYEELAVDLATRWLDTNVAIFDRDQTFYEKYNVVDPSSKPYEGVYPSQTGFGWTNGVFIRLYEDYVKASLISPKQVDAIRA